MRPIEKEKVAIEILMNKKTEKKAMDIAYGIEEEGIPYTINYISENDNIDSNINDYAYEQARKSRISLGIAIGENRAVFHFTKLNKNSPLFVLENLENATREEKRAYGSNIARIVKGIPLKNIQEVIELEKRKPIENEIKLENKIEKEIKTQEMSDKMNIENVSEKVGIYEEVLKKVLEKINENKEVDTQIIEKTTNNVQYYDTNLELAEKLSSEAFENAKKEGLSITVSVVNKGGNLILLKKSDDAIIASIDVSYKKAYTALSLNCPSSKVDLNEFPGLDELMKDKIVLFGGGYPVVYKGKLIGGIGISGGNSEQDERIARTTVQNVINNL